MGRGYPLPSRLGGLGERHELPQRGPGQSPGRKWFLVFSKCVRTPLVATLASMGRQLNISRTNYSANLSYIGLYREQASWQSTKEIDEIHRTIHSDSLFRPIWCPTTLNLPYSEREIKIEGFGGRPPFGGRPGALGPPKSGPAFTSLPFSFFCPLLLFP